MTEKKILLVSPYFYPEAHGLENYVFQIGKRLVKRGYHVTVVCSTYKKKNTIEIIEGMKVFRLCSQWIISATPIRLQLFFDLWKICKKEHFSLVHGHTPVPFFVDIAALVARFQGIPFIVTYHAGSLMKGIKWIDWIAKLYFFPQFFMLKSAKKIIVVSGNICDQLLTRWRHKIEVITPGVDLDIFTFASYKERVLCSVLFAGNISKATRWKGLGLLIQAIALTKKEFPDIQLFVAGSGDNVPEYQQLVKDLFLKKNVHFLGKLNHSELVKQYQSVQMVVIPTITSAEGCPTILFEAMACGAPLIGSRIAGIPYVIENEVNGIIVDRGNSKKLSQAICKLLRDPDLPKKLSITAFEQVKKNFTWDWITDRYDEQYHELLMRIA